MKIILLICMIPLFIVGCAHSQGCIDGINKLPMYGNVKKCQQQIDDDNRFIAICEKESTRKDAAAHMVVRGWQYLYAHKLDTSMMRFNQAWLLDSLNADIYWGFADNLGMQGKFKESLPFFERSLRLNPDDPKVWLDASTSYGNAFLQTKSKVYLNASVNSVKQAIKLKPGNAAAYAQLTSDYCYYTQKDSARKYLKITDKLDPNAVDHNTRAILSVK